MIDPTNYAPVHIEAPQLYACRRCGALVVQDVSPGFPGSLQPAERHDDWHEALALDLARRSS